MSLRLRLPVLLAFVGLCFVIALVLFQAQPVAQPITIIHETQINGDTICTSVVAAGGGDFIEGIVGAPLYLNPLLNDFFPVDQQLSDLIFDGLVRYDHDAKTYVAALAESWEVAADGLTVTFSLRNDLSWHDGEPFTAADVLFSYQLLQSTEFPGSASVGALWQTVSINQIDDFTISFQLSEPYAPFLEATTRGILPAHLLEGVTAVSLPNHLFSRFPIGTGPFKVDLEQDWTQTGQLRLLPNLNSQALPLFDALTFRFFPDFETLNQAFLNGEVHGFSTVPNDQLPIVLQQADAFVITNKTDRFATILFNLGNSGHEALNSAVVRKALSQGIDRQSLIDESLSGQAFPMDGPYLPSSWAFAPQIISLLPATPISTTAVLEAEGWILNEAESVRQKEETLLSLRLVGLGQHRATISLLAAQLEQLGIGVETSFFASGADLRTALDSGLFDLAVVDILPTNDPDLYDFWSQEAIVRGQNYGAWNNRRASEALENGRKLWRIEERRPYYDTFQRIYDAEMPAFTLYQYVDTFIVHADVSGVELGIINRSRDKYATFAQWYLYLEEAEVPCQ